jgi:murein L,D-transpeptidase YafK
MMKSLLLLLLLALLLATGCQKDPIVYDKTPYNIQQCSKELRKSNELHGKQFDEIKVYKKKRLLKLFADEKEIESFAISLGKNGDKGHKQQEGDYRTPEGVYRIVRKKCDRRLYRSLMISYPNTKDRKRAKKRGVSAGGYITIHGQPKWNANGQGDRFTLSKDWTQGCIAMSNRAIDTLWRGVAHGTKITLYP